MQREDVEPAFRVYPPEVAVVRGFETTFQVCEELVDGRWEGFVSIVGQVGRPVRPATRPA